MEFDREEENVIEINVAELAGILWRKAGAIAIVALLVAAAVFLVETLFITPKYTSTTKMLVLARQNEGTLSSGDISTSTSLTQDYVELIQTREVTEEAIRRLGLTVNGVPMTHKQLLKKITVEQPANTRIITIDVEDPDPETARQIADTVRELAAAHIKNVSDTEAVNVADYANLPDEVSSPHRLRDTVLGAAAGFFLACVTILVCSLMDNTIMTSEDVKRYLDLSTLGTIPLQDVGKRERPLKRWIRRIRK